jgi:tyrosyl-tRNA synthetase
MAAGRMRDLRLIAPADAEIGEPTELTVLADIDRSQSREAQAALAMEVTGRVHGEAAAQSAREASRVVFDKRADPRELSPGTFEMLRDELPFTKVAATGSEVGILDLLVDLGFVKSKGDGRRQVQQGAVTINGRKIGADEAAVPASEALHGRYFLVRKGGRDVGLAEVGAA